MELIPLRESISIVEQHAAELKPTTEGIPARWAQGRIIANAVYARRSNPDEPNAAMDGIAIDFRSASQPVSRLDINQYIRINTGERLPDDFNAVIKIEDVEWDADTAVVHGPVPFLHHVRGPGEDVTAGKLLFPPGHRLDGPDVALLLASGCRQVEVFRKPLVAFIPTGAEVVMEPSGAQRGNVIESNSALVAALVDSWGGVLKMNDPIPDEPDDIAQTLKHWSSRADVIVISAGTSRGTRDRSAKILLLLGKLHFHGVAISPAKPVLFGSFESIPVLGLPGYPAAASVASHLYLRMLVCALSGVRSSPQFSTFVSADDIPARPIDIFHRVQCYEVDGQTFVRRISKGAGSTSALSDMDAFMHVPPNTQIKKRDGVRIELLRDRTKNSLAVRGAGDPIIDRLFDLFRESAPAYRLLFWEANAEEALQNIVERNVHLATVNTPETGPDLLPQFTRQVQEIILRYRMFSRSVGVAFAPGADESPAGALTIAIPYKNEKLWKSCLETQKTDREEIKTVLTSNNEQMLGYSLLAGNWSAAFIDLRHVPAGLKIKFIMREHLDVVIPESAAASQAVAQLIDLLLSDHFAQRVSLQVGCDTLIRGLIK